MLFSKDCWTSCRASGNCCALCLACFLPGLALKKWKWKQYFILNIGLSLGFLCMKFYNMRVHCGVIIFPLHSFFKTTSKKSVTDPRASHGLCNFMSKSDSLNFLSRKQSLLTQIFVESEPEVLIWKLLLQNFEEDCSLHFTKN